MPSYKSCIVRLGTVIILDTSRFSSILLVHVIFTPLYPFALMSQDFVLSDLEKLTVPDLKSKLSALGLSTTGRKSDLIHRLKSIEKGMNGDSLDEIVIDDSNEDDKDNSQSNDEKGEMIEQITIIEESVTVNISEHDDQFLENGMNNIQPNDEIRDAEAIDNEGDFDSYINNETDEVHAKENLNLDEAIDLEDTSTLEKNADEGDTVKGTDQISEEDKNRMDIHAYRKDVKRRTINIRNLSDDLNDDIKEYLKKSDQYSLRFSREKSQIGKKIGSAEIRFLTVDEAKEAIEHLKGQKIDELEIEIRHSIDELEEKAHEIDPKDLKTLYIGNLPASATKEMLTVIFKEAKEIDMPLDNTGKSKGHAYLEFENEEEANKALETYAGVSIDDGEATRQLKLMPAAESKKGKHRSRSGSRDKSRSKRESRHRKEYGHDRNRYNSRNYKKSYDHGSSRYDSSRPGNRDVVPSRGRYNNYRNWGPGGSSSMTNPSMMQRVNPQAAMNLLMGVSQLLNNQQQHSPMMSSSYSGGRNNYNKRRYDDRMSGGHYERKIPRRGDGRHY